MLYTVETNDNTEIYKFNNIELKVKCVVKGDTANVYINYNGYNPLCVMLLGDFEAECALDSITFVVKDEIPQKDNSMYAIVAKNDVDVFVQIVFLFIVEHRLFRMMKDRYKIEWDF